MSPTYEQMAYAYEVEARRVEDEKLKRAVELRRRRDAAVAAVAVLLGARQ